MKKKVEERKTGSAGMSVGRAMAAQATGNASKGGRGELQKQMVRHGGGRRRGGVWCRLLRKLGPSIYQ